MFETIIKNFLPRVVQDLLTSAAALLVAHGYITSSQEQGFIGSGFFLVMLVANYMIGQNRKVNAASAGASAVGGSLSPQVATLIAKGKAP